MGKRKVTILEPAVESVAHIAFYVESQRSPKTAKKFVDEAFSFFEKLSDDRVTHKPCKHLTWAILNYRFANFRKKYVAAYLDNSDEIIVCDFVLQKVLR